MAASDKPEKNSNDFERGFFRSPTHQRKFKKNIVILLIVGGLMALIWAVTMIKVAVWMPENTNKAEQTQIEQSADE